MAISLSHFPILCSVLLATIASAATITYDFNITWVRANPDGMFERPTIGINGKWPLPVMQANVGDQVVVNVDNQLGNQTTTLHFHGLYMNGSTEMDGPAGVSQCSIPAGSQFVYNFTVSESFRNPGNEIKYLIAGKPTRHVLVSFPRPRTVSRWTKSTIHH